MKSSEKSSSQVEGEKMSVSMAGVVASNLLIEMTN
jgi:hypothetical protein